MLQLSPYPPPPRSGSALKAPHIQRVGNDINGKFQELAASFVREIEQYKFKKTAAICYGCVGDNTNPEYRAWLAVETRIKNLYNDIAAFLRDHPEKEQRLSILRQLSPISLESKKV